MIRKNNSYQDLEDLSNHYVILGSGLSAIAAIHGIIDSCRDDSKKIFVIDAGITRDNDFALKPRIETNKIPSPKFKIDDNRYVYESFKSLLNLTEDGFDAVGSLAKGGLSNIWGATIQPYTKRELSQFPYSYQGIGRIYSKIYRILTDSARDFGEEKRSSNDSDEFVLDDPLLAINVRNGGGRSCHLNSCANGCIYCNKNVFNSANELDDLMKSKKVEYMPDLFVKSVDHQQGQYTIKCTQISSKKCIDIKASTVYSCLGAISTSKVVLEMSKKDAQVPLLTTPGGAFFMFSFKNFHKKNHQILSSQLFRGNLNNNSFEGNIFPFSENLVMTYFGEKLGTVVHGIFGSLVFSRLFIANIYFSSDLSSSSVVRRNNEIKITAMITSDLRLAFKKTIKVIKRRLFLKGLFVLPIGAKLLFPGHDIHYGGSIPMRKNPQKNQCNFDGELHGCRKFYVTDSASMPFLASKGHSFNSMVNAYYVSSKSIGDKDRPGITAL